MVARWLVASKMVAIPLMNYINDARLLILYITRVTLSKIRSCSRALCIWLTQIFLSKDQRDLALLSRVKRRIKGGKITPPVFFFFLVQLLKMKRDGI